MFAHCKADNKIEDEVKRYMFLDYEDLIVDLLKY